jgi:Pentapeptide repeats (8 copies)
MLNRFRASLLKGAKLSLMIAVIWTPELLLQVGSATAQPACELQPCDCNGPFERPPSAIASEELIKAIAAHHSWQSKIASEPEYWTTEDQIKQYDPMLNVPDSGEGKYKCSSGRNGPYLLANLDLRTGARVSDVFAKVDLPGACFRKSDLRDANLNNSNLQGANFYKADLSGASLVGANLTRAILDCANLRGVDLTGATLTDADLYRALLGGAFANHAQLERARFEPIELPPVRNLWEAQGLEKLRWIQNPSALFALREEFRRSGQDYQANRLTYAIEHQNTFDKLGKWDEDALSALVGLIRLAFIEWTTGYGLYPFRALGILLALVVIFGLGYTIPLKSWSAGGVYRIWPERSLQENGLSDRAEVERLHPCGSAVAGYALWFSLLTAFHIGWRELNVGSWLARLQTGEYLLQATGWVRFAAGAQSLISVYLLSIWALTYFGRPFG